MNLKDDRVEALAAEVAALTGESKTAAVRQALQERRDRLLRRQHLKRRGDLWHYMETEIWSHIPPEVLGKPISKAEREEILGYGPDGV